MSDCNVCPVEKECHYIYKPCDCVHQRKFWSIERRAPYDKNTAQPLRVNGAHPDNEPEHELGDYGR